MKKFYFILIGVIITGLVFSFVLLSQTNKQVAVWKTYYSNEFKFSVEYPEELNPVDLHNESEVVFYNAQGSNAPMRIHVSPIPQGLDLSKYPLDLENISQADDNKRFVTEVIFGNKIYTIILDNFEKDDAQHILQSITF